MLPLVLVSLLVSGALAAAVPVTLTQYSINEIPPLNENGRFISSALTRNALDNVDGGDSNVYTLTLLEGVHDLANQQDRNSQSLAIAQTIAILGELATGVPGQSCEAAAVINAFAGSVRTGNKSGLRPAVMNYLARLANNIDLIVGLVNNPDSLRSAVGPRGNCAGGGRRYEFEAVWDAVLNSANINTVGLLNEQYCSSKRLYSAFNIRTNNVGAAATAAAVPQVTRAVGQALNAVVPFLKVVANGGNPAGLAAGAKQALLRAGSSVPL
ncbi:hypothetical protein evm_005666 [Chilo suppressalis]|nr:hypothetical protein evm_005666 [Chilo suppressalis]